MPTGRPVEAETYDFYIRTMQALQTAGLPFLVGGGAALSHYTGIARDPKDFDIFVERHDYEAVMAVLAGAGYHTELTFPHWLGKARCVHGYVDVIFNSGNGVAVVDAGWFQHATDGQAFGVGCRLVPVEEMIWSKAYIMERERYDAADIMHLIAACAERLDWARLLERFAAHWRVLYSHLVLFGFIYPYDRERIPDWVMRGLAGRLEHEIRLPAPTDRTCQGTLLSREQYLVDVQRFGLADVRNTAASSMTPSDVERWTQAIDEK